MKAPLLVAVIALIHGSYAVLFIKGPTEPVLEGHSLRLECLSSDLDLNNTLVHFERFSLHSQRWQRVYPYFQCFSQWRYGYGLLNADNAVLRIHAVRYDTLFRCVLDGDNVTETVNSSLPFAVKVRYMDNPSLSLEGYTSYLRVPQELRMRLGDELVLNCTVRSSEESNIYWSKEGSDWILPSSTLTLSKLSEMDEGKYTCMAENPEESLRKRSSVSIIVLPEDAPWYETTNGRLILVTSGAAVGAMLVVFVLFMSALLLCRRARRAKTSRRPIDDRSQIQPIYKASVESLPSTCGDKQPLV